MSRQRIAPPVADEYVPYYAGYVALAREHDPLALLEGQRDSLRAMCASLTEEQALARYAPDKWSIKEVLGHLADTERVFSYRLFRISRGDRTPLAGFDQNAYVAGARFDQRPLGELLDEFLSVRNATLQLVNGLTPEELARHGIANEAAVSARALVYIAAGHVAHHLKILRDSYGVNIP
ncbi:MAG TPA: DinB family protein [Gemmatimonadaceae bacterium]|nr:DinB family protein [Gemmatimonadaceae bacterium]